MHKLTYLESIAETGLAFLYWFCIISWASLSEIKILTCWARACWPRELQSLTTSLRLWEKWRRSKYVITFECSSLTIAVLTAFRICLSNSFFFKTNSFWSRIDSERNLSFSLFPLNNLFASQKSFLAVSWSKIIDSLKWIYSI